MNARAHPAQTLRFSLRDAIAVLAAALAAGVVGWVFELVKHA